VLRRFVSKSVRTGFVNALAILIFAAQLPHILHGGWLNYAMIAAGLAVIYLMPRLTKAIPSPLICILVLTLGAVALQLPVMTIADLGTLPDSLPIFAWPTVPLTLDTLQIIAGPALAIAMVGLLESMMTASVVDDLTDTPSPKNRECTGLGLANVAASLFGGIAGCGMIGQTVSNVKYGGRGRLSTLFAGALLLVLMVLLKPWVSQVPVAALVAIMIMVSIDTFDWSSLRSLVVHPKMSSVVMVATVIVTVFTANLALGVAVGVLLSGVFFTFKVARLMKVEAVENAETQTLTYRVSGQVFFASADMFVEAFDFRDALGKRAVIDLTHAHFWDITAVAALDRVVQRFKAHDIEVEVLGLNRASATLIDGLGVAGDPNPA
jgi:sulfate permease, SulP family